MENITKTIERISQLIETKELSINAFSKKIGVSNSYFNKMIKNNASVGSEIIEKILRIFPDVNANWLLKGEEPMIIPKKPMGALDFVFYQAKYWGEIDQALNKLSYPGCEACRLKDMILANQQQTIQSQEKIIQTLERDLHTCRQSSTKKD